MWGCRAAVPPTLTRSYGQLWIYCRSSDYVRPGTGNAIDAEERLHVMGPVLVTPHHHFPCFRRTRVVSQAFRAGFLRR
jgi:hypothetical protein